MGMDEPHMESFCETYNLTNLIIQPTCYKNPDSPTCISKHSRDWGRAIRFSFNDIDSYENWLLWEKHWKSRGLESLIMGHLNIFSTNNLESLL